MAGSDLSRRYDRSNWMRRYHCIKQETTAAQTTAAETTAEETTAAGTTAEAKEGETTTFVDDLGREVELELSDHPCLRCKPL